jgi:hypothetical protein
MSCMICWEDKKEICTLLQENIFSDSVKNYKVICLCNIRIHKTCMNKWIQKNKSCPICHNALYEYQTLYSYLYTLLLSCIKYIYSLFVNVVLSLIIVHLLLILYLVYFIKLYYEIRDIYYNIVKYL